MSSSTSSASSSSSSSESSSEITAQERQHILDVYRYGGYTYRTKYVQNIRHLGDGERA